VRIVPKAAGRPHVCAVYPHIGGEHPRGFFETGNTITAIDPQIYVSVVAVEHMAREIGFIDGPDHQGVLDELAQARAALEQAEARISDLEAVIDAIDTIESADFRARRKAGRKPAAKTETEVAA
jgi:hypothetical protein